MLIGEVAAQSGISARMLRHYDSIGLVSPSERTAGGYRRYSEEDIRRLFHVEALRSLGLTLQEVADALDDPAFTPGSAVDGLLGRTRERIEREHQLLRRLERVRDSGPGAWSEVLRIIGLMHGLDSEDPSARQQAVLTTAPEQRDAAMLVDAAIKETDPNAAGAFDWALARIGDDAVPLLAEALGSSDEPRRRRAAATLEKIGSARALKALGAASADPVVTARAALARGRHGDAGAVPALIGLIVEGRNDVEAADALETLAVQSDQASEILDALAGQLESSAGGARLRLTSALAGIPGERARTILGELAEDDDEPVALTAKYLLRMRAYPT
ncbi:MerR family transcriptional regulator [Microbacterium sp. KUDC0406]|uniref:MerR family transcriptional regulator n=1 Tax=Microbacterium sp. KUDC0406 TaxID=2909588 RepID=UPI001F416C70|nr:MerR family transcriptional regulator [Microbacterium sp. KUDC0406]UJP11279.1 MerR family transcriptional regulator [Microbacterium sp. KUDC0406]